MRLRDAVVLGIVVSLLSVTMPMRCWQKLSFVPAAARNTVMLGCFIDEREASCVKQRFREYPSGDGNRWNKEVNNS
jgi:hypothetical protein